jgi:drug/metabolite transporter (DMT)-like permease
MMSSRPSPALALWLVFGTLSAIWGSSFLFIKIGVDEGLPPFSLVTGRLAMGSLALVVMGRLMGARLPRDRSVLAKVVFLGFANVALPFSLITWGEQTIPSAVASILNGLVPLFTIVFAAIALHDEPMTLNRLTGLLIGFGGAVLILARNVGPGGLAGASLSGELAVVLAAAAYAACAVYIRRHLTGRNLVDDPVRGMRPMDPIEFALLQVASAAVFAALFALVTEWIPAGGVVLPPTAPAWFAIAWLGVLGSAVAYLLMYRLISAWGATRATLVTYVMPVVGIALGVAVLGETLDARAIIGSAIVLGGILLVNSRVGQRRLFGRAPVRHLEERLVAADEE